MPASLGSQMGYRVTVDQDECMSSGKCVADFPDAFEFDEDELAAVRDGQGGLTDEQLVRAARNCPSSAIQLFDSSGAEVPI